MAKRTLINAQPDHLCIDHLLPVLISASVKRDGVLQQMYCKCTDCPGLTSKLLFKELGCVALNLKEVKVLHNIEVMYVSGFLVKYRSDNLFVN